MIMIYAYIYIDTSLVTSIAVYTHIMESCPRQVWKDGARYQGSWRAGEFHGEGRREMLMEGSHFLKPTVVALGSTKTRREQKGPDP